MEKKIEENNVKAMILCNPHNPGGRVWNKEELKQLSELCLKHRVILFSDEIHQDLTLFDHTFTSMLTINPNLDDLLDFCFYFRNKDFQSSCNQKFNGIYRNSRDER